MKCLNLSHRIVIKQNFYHGTSVGYDNKSAVFCEEFIEQVKHFVIFQEENIALGFRRNIPKEITHKLSKPPVGDSLLPLVVQNFTKPINSFRVSHTSLSARQIINVEFNSSAIFDLRSSVM